MSTVFDVPQVTVPIHGTDDVFPARRVYCVGRNYAAHAREMGFDPDRDPPFFFCKPADALLYCAPGETVDMPYPSRSENLHHEIELVVAIGGSGTDVSVEDANSLVFGYAVGLDMTRRDLQLALRDKGRPWEAGKAFDSSAPIGPIHRVADTGILDAGEISVAVNGQMRQQSDLTHLIWSIPEVIANLSTLFALKAGDLIYTGTPEGVGAVERGDVMTGKAVGVGEISVRMV